MDALLMRIFWWMTVAIIRIAIAVLTPVAILLGQLMFEGLRILLPVVWRAFRTPRGALVVVIAMVWLVGGRTLTMTVLAVLQLAAVAFWPRWWRWAA